MKSLQQFIKESSDDSLDIEYWEEYCEKNGIESGAKFNEKEILNGLDRTATHYRTEG